MAGRENSPESGPTPNQARIYDYLLGGHSNLPVDREVADALLALSPVTKATAVESSHRPGPGAAHERKPRRDGRTPTPPATPCRPSSRLREPGSTTVPLLA
jgi:hypothetical protein